MKRKMLSAAVMSAMLAVASAAQAGITFTVDPDGPGGDATKSVGSLDWAVGNSIAVADEGENLGSAFAFVGQELTVFAHARLAAFNDALGDPLPGGNLNGSYEWTFVTRFREVISDISGPVTTTTVVADQNNVFEIYYNAAVDSSQLTGKNFENGTLIFRAIGGSGGGVFEATLVDVEGVLVPATGDLDGSADGNQYQDYETLLGEGSTSLLGVVTYLNPSFFTDLSVGDSVTVDFTTQQRLNYNNTNPSSCFWGFASGYFDGAGNGIAGGCGEEGDFGTIGILNGVNGPNVMFQTDASMSLNAERIPEPASLALLGAGLFGLVAAGRRRRKA